MLVRFLKMSGWPVKLVQCDEESARSNQWAKLDRETQDRLVDELSRLAQGVLSDAAEWVPLEAGAFGDWLTANRGPWILYRDEVAARVGIYPLTPARLSSLVTDHRMNLPDGYLLDQSEFPLPSPEAPGARPYVTYHIRQGSWSSERNTAHDSLLRDLVSVADLFPGHDVMILSSQKGREWAREVVELHADAWGASEGSPMREQPVDGFLSPLYYRLHSAFYFQRLGGGTSEAAIYSTVPYLIMTRDINYYAFTRKGFRVVPWATTTQRFLNSPDSGERPITL